MYMYIEVIYFLVLYAFIYTSTNFRYIFYCLCLGCLPHVGHMFATCLVHFGTFLVHGCFIFATFLQPPEVCTQYRTVGRYVRNIVY